MDKVTLPQPPEERDDGARFRAVGRLLFGRALRLFVAHWVLSCRGEPFYQMELVQACGRHGTNALAPLSQLMELGMVEEMPDYIPGRRRKYYRQLDHQLWAAVEVAVTAAGEDPYAVPRLSLAEKPELAGGVSASAASRQRGSASQPDLFSFAAREE